MNKEEMAGELAERMNVTKKEAKEFIDAYATIIIEEVRRGERIVISDFGSFNRVKKSSKRGVDPNSGEGINIPEKFKPKFSPSKKFEMEIEYNGEDEGDQ